MLRGGVVCCLKIGLGDIICFVGGREFGNGGGGGVVGERVLLKVIIWLMLECGGR